MSTRDNINFSQICSKISCFIKTKNVISWKLTWQVSIKFPHSVPITGKTETKYKFSEYNIIQQRQLLLLQSILPVLTGMQIWSLRPLEQEQIFSAHVSACNTTYRCVSPRRIEDIRQLMVATMFAWSPFSNRDLADFSFYCY